MSNKPKLTMIELFNGISAQKRGIDNTGLFDLEVIATSDIDKEVIVECAAIHYGLTNEMVENYKNYPTKEEMAQSLTDRKIGLDFKTGKVYDWFKLAKKKSGMDLEKYWLAAELTHNMGDISNIDCLPYADVVTYSFPCTDISIAGKQEGLSKDSGTRSGLLWEVERLLVAAKERNELPKYLLMENVDALVSKKFKPEFDTWCKRLEELNYNSYFQILNAKECGVPQNRRRIFCMSIRKDIDTGNFTFPIPFDTGVRLKDILEKNVDEKYYINTERASNLIQQLIDKGQLKGQRECCDSTINDPSVRDVSNAIIARYDAGISNYRQTGLAVAEPQPILVKNQGTEYVKDLDESVTLKARDWKGWDNYGSTAIVESEKIDKSERIGGMFDDETKHQAGSVWNTNGLAPTLDTMQGGLRQPCIVDETNVEPKERFFKQALETFHNNDCEEGDTIDAFNKRVNKSGYSPTLTTRPEGFKTAILPVVKDEIQLTNGGCVDCDECLHRTEDCLCDISNNDEGCPIVNNMAKNYHNNIETAKPICVGNTTPSGKSQCNAVYSTEGVSQTLCAGTHGYATGNILEETNNIDVVGNYMPSNHDASRVVSTNGIAPCVKENHGTVTGIVEEQSKLNEIKYNTEVVGIKQATKKGYIECELPGCADLSYPTSTTRRGRVQDNGQTSPTITATETGVHYIESIYRIRKLTVRECFKLMGFEFLDWDKCSEMGISNSAGYKAAGNSIVTDCIKLLFEHLYQAQYDEMYVCTDERMQNFTQPKED